MSLPKQWISLLVFSANFSISQIDPTIVFGAVSAEMKSTRRYWRVQSFTIAPFSLSVVFTSSEASISTKLKPHNTSPGVYEISLIISPELLSRRIRP